MLLHHGGVDNEKEWMEKVANKEVLRRMKKQRSDSEHLKIENYYIWTI